MKSTSSERGSAGIVPDFVRIVASVVLGVFFAAAIVVHAIFVNTAGPLYAVDQASPLWVLCSGLFVVLQVPAGQAFPPSLPGACCGCIGSLLRQLFFALTAILWIMACICFSIYGRADMAVYSVLVASASLLAVDAAVAARAGPLELAVVSDDEVAPTPAASCGARCTELCNAITAAFFLLFLVLQLTAAVTQASGIVSFPPRGSIVELTLSNGDMQRIHYQCEGPKTSGNPTFVMDGSGSHGIVDFWPLQREMVNRGQRVCLLDKPGFGYSDNYLAWQNADPQTMYDPFIRQLESAGEGSSFVMVGWGGGGVIQYEYALSHPERAAGFVFLDTLADGIEWRTVAARLSQTQAELDAAKSADLSGRAILFALLRGIGAPCGLLPVFVPANPDEYAWPERFDEYRWNYVTPKTWTTQWFSLLPEYTARTIIGSLGVFDRKSSALSGRPTLMVATNRTRQAVCDKLTAEQCADRIFDNNFALAEKAVIANITGASSTVYCTDDRCSLSMPLRLPAFVASAIMNQSWPVLP